MQTREITHPTPARSVNPGKYLKGLSLDQQAWALAETRLLMEHRPGVAYVDAITEAAQSVLQGRTPHLDRDRAERVARVEAQMALTLHHPAAVAAA